MMQSVRPAIFSTHTASPPPPRRIPAGPGVSGREDSRANKSARGPLAWLPYELVLLHGRIPFCRRFAIHFFTLASCCFTIVKVGPGDPNERRHKNPIVVISGRQRVFQSLLCFDLEHIFRSQLQLARIPFLGRDSAVRRRGLDSCRRKT